MKKLARIGITLFIALGFIFMVTGCGDTNEKEVPKTEEKVVTESNEVQTYVAPQN